MKKIISMSLLGVCMIFMCSCSKQSESAEDTIFSMDTVMQLTVYGENAKDTLTKAEQKIYQLDALCSVTNESSEVALINALKKKNVLLSDDLYEIIKKSLTMSTLTERKFQISLYPVTKLWGFTTGSNYVPTSKEIHEALARTGDEKIKLSDDHKLTIPDSMEIDFGGIAKGFTSQKIIDMAKENKADGILVSLGGNVQAWGTKPDKTPWNIGIAEPDSPNEQIARLSIENKAVITSGGYQRYFVKDGKTYEHIMDPETGSPVENDLDSVTIISEDAAYADALSTALTVMGKEQAIEFWRNNKTQFDMIMVSENDIYVTEGLADSFSLLKDKYKTIWVNQ